MALTKSDTKKTVKLQFSYPQGKAPPPLDLVVNGDVVIHVAGHGSREANFLAPEQITANFARDVQLTVQFSSPAISFPTPVTVESVAWEQDMRSDSESPKGALPKSSILSGSLSLEEFERKGS